MSNVFPLPKPDTAGQSKAMPMVEITLDDLQALAGWAAIGAKHFKHRDLAREFQAQADAANAELERLGVEFPHAD